MFPELRILTSNATHSSLRCPLTACFPRTSLIRACVDCVILIVNVITWLPRRAADARRLVSPIEITGEIDKRHVINKHIRPVQISTLHQIDWNHKNLRSSKRPIVSAILGNHTPALGASHIEVAEQHVSHASPSCASGLIVTFVVSIAALH